jgi:hypothetical protein
VLGGLFWRRRVGAHAGHLQRPLQRGLLLPRGLDVGDAVDMPRRLLLPRRLGRANRVRLLVRVPHGGPLDAVRPVLSLGDGVDHRGPLALGVGRALALSVRVRLVLAAPVGVGVRL